MMEGAEIKALIERHRFAVTAEAELQVALCQIFTKEKIIFQTEVRLGPGDRVDMMIGSVALELKVKPFTPRHIEQIWRYLKYEQVTEIVYVTTRRTALRISALLDKRVHLALAATGPAR